MTTEDKPNEVEQNQAADIDHIKRRLDMLDQRLDNIDSVVTAVVERIMSQPIALNITCPNCGQNVEITILGKGKPTA